MSYPFPWGPPPPGYVPGLGRGAMGFVSSIEKAPIDLESDAVVKSKQALDKIREENQKADEFYERIEEIMKKRNKAKKRSEPAEVKTVFEAVRENFADLRQGLKTISANEWENLPEIGATTYHRPKWDLYTFASDRTIAHDFDQSALSKAARDEDEQRMIAAAQAQRESLNVQLSRIAPEQNTIDVSKFLYELDQEAATAFEQYKDLDRAAELYRSMTHADKTDERGWLMRERIEERRGRIAEARKAARRGMINCPGSELLVMESARLSTRAEAIALLESALKVNHAKSEKLWLQLLTYQPDTNAKKATLEKALRALPQSETLWRATAGFETREEHVETLKNAVSIIPTSKALWIDGVKSSLSLEDGRYFFENGKKGIGEDVDLYISWAQLAEKFENLDEMTDACRKAYLIEPTRDWIVMAQTVEGEGYAKTANAIISTIGSNSGFLDAARVAEHRGYFEVARCLFEKYASDNLAYTEILLFEKRHGNLNEYVKKLLEKCPDNERVILDISEVVESADAIPILENSIERIDHSESLYLSLINKLAENRKLDRAIEVAQKARQVMSHSVLIAQKLAELYELQGGNVGLLSECCQSFPWIPSFWTMLSEHTEPDKRLSLLKSAITHCGQSTELHLALIRAALVIGMPRPRIRALFERARSLCSSDPLFWLFMSEFECPENRVSLLEEAKSVANDGIGMIWARQIELSEPETRYTLAKDALPETNGARELLLVLALCLWRAGSVEKARAALTNINREHPEWGDGWLFRLRFEQSFGNPEDPYRTLSSIKLNSGLVWLKSRNNPEYYGYSQQALIKELVDAMPDPLLTDCSIFLDALKLV